ncbi:ribonuclease H family protein [Bifidobacterium parmae]
MGWAWADHARDAGGDPGHEHDSRGYDAGGATNGTNQIGELCAVLEALRAHPGEQQLIIESDSQYAINCSTKWVKGWKRNGWKNSQKKPVKNRELIQAIDEAISKRPGPVEFRWVKGHAGNAGNELVDELARTYAGDCRSGARDGYLPIEGWRSLLNSEYSRGTDVPPDVQLVLDGKADAASLRRDAGRAATQDDSGSRKSLADLLAEPEGVPDDLGGVGGTAPDAAETRTASSHTEIAQSMSLSAQPASPVQPVAQPALPAPSGLRVTGDVRFSPAPKTSPYFDGMPMHVRGYIAVDGFVDGDGNLTITDADFLRD